MEVDRKEQIGFVGAEMGGVETTDIELRRMSAMELY